MATFSRSLLSGSAVGGYEALPTDESFHTVHQTSTVSGVVEDVTVEVANRGAEAATVTVRIEQDGTLKDSFTEEIAAGSSVKVLDQLALGHNVDVKLNWVGGLSNAIVPMYSVISAGYRYAEDALSSSAITILGTPCGLDETNGYLFTQQSGTIRIYNIVSGALLGAANGFPTNVRNFSVTEQGKKAVVSSGGNERAKYFDYSDPTSFAATDFHSNLGTSSYAAVATKSGIVVWYGPAGYFYKFAWDNVNSGSYLGGYAYLPNTYDIAMVSNPLGEGWCAFSINTASYNAVSGNWTTNVQCNSSTYVSAGAFKRSASAETLYLIGNVSNGNIRRYTAGNGTVEAYWSNSSRPNHATAGQGAYYGVDSTGDECLFYLDTTPKLTKYNLTDSVISGDQNGSYSYRILFLGDFSALATPPVFAGFANRMTP